MALDQIQRNISTTDTYGMDVTATAGIQTPAQVTAQQVAAEHSLSSALNYVLFFCLFFAYYLTASATLEDYDSVNLAMAVLNYDLTLDAPHPPGAPIFVACVKLINLLIADIPLALTLVAALGGALFVCVWHRLFQEFLSSKTATIGAIVLAFSPGLWMTASRPMSDSLAAATLSVAVLMALQYAKSRQSSYLLYFAAVLAITVGIRPQFGLLAPFLFFATFVYFRPPVQTVLKALTIFTLTNLAWLIPTVVSQYNLDGAGWMTYFNQIARFKESFDTASGSPLLANNIQFGEIVYRAATHIGTLGYFSLGLNMWYPESVGTLLSKLGTTLNPWPADKYEWTALGTLYTFAYSFGAMAFVPRIRYYWKKARGLSQAVAYLLLVSIAYSIVVVMLVPPHTRFYIALLPCFILLPLMGLQSRRWGHKFQYAFMVIAIAASLHTIIESVSLDAPPIALVKEIQKQTNEHGEGSVLLLNANAVRQASWYLKQADIYGGHEKVAPAAVDGVFKPGVRVFSNYPDAFPEELVQRTELAHYHRPYRIWMRHTSTPLYELSLRSVPIATKNNPPAETVDELLSEQAEPEVEQEQALTMASADES